MCQSVMITAAITCHVMLATEADIKTRHNELEITLRVDQQEAQTHVHCAP